MGSFINYSDSCNNNFKDNGKYYHSTLVLKSRSNSIRFILICRSKFYGYHISFFGKLYSFDHWT